MGSPINNKTTKRSTRRRPRPTQRTRTTTATTSRATTTIKTTTATTTTRATTRVTTTRRATTIKPNTGSTISTVNTGFTDPGNENRLQSSSPPHQATSRGIIGPGPSQIDNEDNEVEKDRVWSTGGSSTASQVVNIRSNQ